MKYIYVIKDSFTGYWNYLIQEITHPGIHNYFYLLIAASVLVWLLELSFPWRKNQSAIRKDFWLDGFYMFFNFFLFSLIVYNALSNIGVELFNDGLGVFGVKNHVAFEVQSWPAWSQLLLLFFLVDFIHYWVHRLLHTVPALWQFHKVHHSVREMGFAAHLRFHPMETVVYKSITYLPLTMIGFGLDDFFIVHAFSLLIGHLNHANLNLKYGILGYFFNNPRMHIWHHAKDLPKGRRTGVNFGISLSVWDYVFGTNYIPASGRDIELGFDDVEHYPEGFLKQQIEPFKKHEN